MNPAPDSSDRVTARDFEWVRRTVYDHVGIDLRGKETLVEARLRKQMRELNFNTFRELREYVGRDQSGKSLTQVVDALTTNHTSFFREPQHFDFLRDCVVPKFSARPRLRVWSAACSTGEEPYSIAFAIIEAMGQAAHSKLSILATDISTRVLQIAKRGVYPSSRFQHVSIDRLRRHVLKGFGPERDNYIVKPEIKSLVHFESINLMEDISSRGPFDVVFCRNVMIYFDRETQEGLVNRLAARLEPGGYLLIGHAESLNGVRHPLKYVQPAVYQRQSAQPAGSRAGVTR